MMGYKLHVMMQATYPEDQANLPNGVYVLRTYTELHDSNCSVSVVLRNLMGKMVHLAALRLVVRVVATNIVLNVTPSPEFLKKLDEMEPSQDPPKKLTVEEKHKFLLELLKKDSWLDKLKTWPSDLALKFKWMLMEHHHIFSLELNEEVQEHIQEMLNRGAVCKSHSPC